jgi:HlyD family secretion protein
MSKQNDIIAKIKIIPDVVMLNNAEMRLKTAIINFKNAQTEMDRQKKLYDENVISQQDYNQYSTGIPASQSGSGSSREQSGAGEGRRIKKIRGGF